MQRIGRVLPILVAILVGLIMLGHIFVTQSNRDDVLWSGLNQAGSAVITTTTIVVTFALLLGFINVAKVHLNHIRVRDSSAIYSGVLLASLVITIFLGAGGPTTANARFIFDFILQPLESTFFALLALFIATAAFRAFRIQNLETFFFVVFAIIVLLGQVPISIYLWAELPIIKDWILNVPTLAGVRGILLGVALGTVASGLRILIGADRPYAE